MKKLFLCSEFYIVADHIFKNFIRNNKQKVLFITTAAETHKGEKNWVINDRKAWVDTGFNVTDFTVTGKTNQEVEEAFRDTDIIYSTGGNVLYYLKQIQLSNSLEVYRNVILNQGKIYVGGSAGSMITSPNLSVKNYPENSWHDPTITDLRSLNLVNFLIFPHWTREDFKSRYLDHQIKYAYSFTKNQPKIILLTDNQYILVEGDMYQIIDKND